MYYEECWIDGKLFWRGTPTERWIEADAAKLNRALWEAHRELKALRQREPDPLRTATGESIR